MTQGDVHDNHGTYSAYEYATGKYAMPVTLVPGIPSSDVAGAEVQGTSAAGSTAKQGNPVRIGAKYKATPVTRSDGETSDLVTDINENLKIVEQQAPQYENNTDGVASVAHKPVVSSTYSPTAFSNFGAANNANVKATNAQIFSIEAQNENAAIRYLQIFNLAAAPTDDSSTPIFSWAIPAGTANNPGICERGRDFFGQGGYYLSTGLSWGISVDPDVFDNTGVTAGEHQVNGTYK